MGSPKKANQTLKSKNLKSAGQYFNKKVAAFLVVVTAAVGVYFMFFASAAVNNCSAVKGGNVCDINQASSDVDATWSVGPGVQNLITNSGWKDLGVPFRAPTFAYNGAVPVTRFFRKDITAHNLVPNTNPLHKTYKADSAHYLDEGVLFYAWPDGREPGTVPIYSADRKALWFYKVFTDNKTVHNQYLNSADKSWQDGGILFWAYPANWYPPINSAPTAKNAGCPNANLKQGDRGSCVQTLKTTLNSYGATPKIDANNDLFDDLTHRNVIYYLGKLQARGVRVENYTSTVTPGIWQAFANGYPPTPPTAKTPAKSAEVPVKTNAKPPANAKPGPKTNAKPDPKTDAVKLDCRKPADQKTAFCKDILAKFNKIVAQNNKKKQDEDFKKWVDTVNLQKLVEFYKQQDAQKKEAAKIAAANKLAVVNKLAPQDNIIANNKKSIKQVATVQYSKGCRFSYNKDTYSGKTSELTPLQAFPDRTVPRDKARARCTNDLKTWRKRYFTKPGDYWYSKKDGNRGYNFHSRVVN